MPGKKSGQGGVGAKGKTGGAEKSSAKGKKAVDMGVAEGVASGSTATATEPAAPVGGLKNMVLNLKGKDKRERNAIYTGAAVSLRFPLAAFPDKTPPATLDVAGLAEKKARLTPEERKEARKNAPKPTLADRVAAAEKRAAALREKLAKTTAPV